MSLSSIEFNDIHDVTPADGTDLPKSPAQGFQVSDTSGGAFVTVVTLQGTTIAVPVIAGIVYTCAITRIKATGTTADGIKAWYGQRPE